MRKYKLYVTAKQLSRNRKYKSTNETQLFRNIFEIKMSRILSVSLLISVLVIIIEARYRDAYILDERWVCKVKNTCMDCLSLSHCSWCQSEKICYSKTLPNFFSFCQNNTVEHVDYGLSIKENAECSCAGGKVERNCYPIGVSEGPECSNRGTCVCGHCVCDPNPYPEFPTKTVMGEFCEYDNFSCNTSTCNEGPYSLIQTKEENVYLNQLDNEHGNKTVLHY